MSDVVVIGAGYAGAGAVVEGTKHNAIDLTWISADPYHEVKHEIHRAIREPSIGDGLRVETKDIVNGNAQFIEGYVDGIDVNEQTVSLADGSSEPYDYLVVTVGAQTAFYGIPGLREHAKVLERVADAQSIHEDIINARSDTVRVVVGGAGLSGVQATGELHELAEALNIDIELTLVEALPDVMPKASDSLRERVKSLLEERDVILSTGTPITEVDADMIHLDGADPLSYDVLIWTGGIEGRAIDHGGELEDDRGRLVVNQEFRTSNDRVFALGDAAIIEQPEGIAPPTAQAAWQAAPVAMRNVVASIEGRPLQNWTYQDKGTLVSVGDKAVAHGVTGIPIDTFGSLPAVTLKKFVASRWIAQLSSWPRAMRVWQGL